MKQTTITQEILIRCNDSGEITSGSIAKQNIIIGDSGEILARMGTDLTDLSSETVKQIAHQLALTVAEKPKPPTSDLIDVVETFPEMVTKLEVTPPPESVSVLPPAPPSRKKATK